MSKRLSFIVLSLFLSTNAIAQVGKRQQGDDERTQQIKWPNPTKDPAKVAVILFCPHGIQPPKDYQQGIDRLADYTDKFLLDGVKRWKYSSAVETIFRRKDDGHVEVFGVFGEKQADQYNDPSFHKEAISKVIEHYKFGPKSHIWWVLGYKGPPPIRFEGFRGGQSPKFGGWSVANYDSRVSGLRNSMAIGSPLLREMALKGMIHELGHAFRLPHIGPRYELKKGNTLMGPTHANFRRVTGRFVENGYVSQAAAAMLAAHPVFRGRPLVPRKVPRIQLSGAKIETDRKTKSVSVSGQVKGPQPVFAIVADDSRKRPGEYWTRHYVTQVGTNGRFQVDVNEPIAANGEFRLWFVFPNGELTGNGRMQGSGDRGATKIPYRFQNGQWMAQ